MIQWWTGGEASWLSRSEPPLHPDAQHPDEAFDQQGRPVAQMHAVFGPLVRQILSPAAWADLELKRTDPSAWLRAHVPDPAGGPPLTHHALRAREKADLGDPITLGNWELAWEVTALERMFRESDGRTLTAVARALAELAGAGMIAISARPLAGGVSTPLDRSVWKCGPEQRVRILAACGLNLASPHDPAAKVDHLLFVDPRGFHEAAEDYAERNWMPIPELADEPRDRGRRPAGRKPRYPNLEAEMVATLSRVLEDDGTANWRLPDLLAYAARSHPGVSTDVVELVARQLKQRFSGLRRRGRPPKGGRLVEVVDMATEKNAGRRGP